MRTLQEWMGHLDIKITLIYADYAASAQEMVGRAFSRTPGSDDDVDRPLGPTHALDRLAHRG